MVWKFAESEEDGRAWMRNPNELQGFIDFRSSDDGDWRRIMVVTKAWVQRQLDAVQTTAAGSGRVVFASMLVLPDAEPSELRTLIDVALAAGGVEHFASAAIES